MRDQRWHILPSLIWVFRVSLSSAASSGRQHSMNGFFISLPFYASVTCNTVDVVRKEPVCEGRNERERGRAPEGEREIFSFSMIPLCMELMLKKRRTCSATFAAFRLSLSPWLSLPWLFLRCLCLFFHKVKRQPGRYFLSWHKRQ